MLNICLFSMLLITNRPSSLIVAASDCKHERFYNEYRTESTRENVENETTIDVRNENSSLLNRVRIQRDKQLKIRSLSFE
jgi:hypothetical protein